MLVISYGGESSVLQASDLTIAPPRPLHEIVNLKKSGNEIESRSSFWQVMVLCYGTPSLSILLDLLLAAIGAKLIL